MPDRRRPRSPSFFRRLLRIYPFDFRADFGTEMEEVFDEQYRAAARKGGAMSTLRLWLGTCLGILETAPREHWDVLRQDASYALRTLGKSKGFAAVAILTLALGIATLTVFFSVYNAFLLRPLPFADPENLVHLWQTDEGLGQERLRVSVPNFRDWREQSHSLQGLGGYFYSSYKVSSPEDTLQAVQITGGSMTPNLFPLLGTGPLLGRVFQEGEEEAGRDDVVVISEGLWRDRFGQDPHILDRELRLDERPHRIIGVMPASFVFPFAGVELWKPLSLRPWDEERDLDGPLLVVGRLASGHDLASAQAELDTIMGRLAREYPQSNHLKGARVVPLREALLFFYDMFRATTHALLGAAGFLLLIVCANLGNLQLARASRRSREIALRTALGANRGRIVRQLLTESLAVAVAGGVLGTALAAWGGNLMDQAIPGELYRVGRIGVDAKALLFALLVSILASLLFGLAPALQATRIDASPALKEGAHSGRDSAGGQRLRKLLVVGETALATVLLAGSALMLQTFFRLSQVDMGFEPDRLMTLELKLPDTQYPSAQQQNLFYEELAERVKGLPGIADAATVYPLPLNFESMGDEFTIVGHPPPGPEDRRVANLFWISPRAIETLQIPLLQGRTLESGDDGQAPRVALVNQRWLDTYWPTGSPLGTRIVLRNESQSAPLEIVGVVGDSKVFQLSEDQAAVVYLPQLQSSTRRRFLLARTRGDPLAVTPSLHQVIRQLDADLPVTNPRSMRQVVSESLGPWMGGTAGLSLLGFGAVLLAAIGLYGVVSYAVGSRQHEIGVRIALGATRSRIMRLVLGEGLTLGLIGIGLGVLLALGTSQALRSLLFGVEFLDPVTFLGMPLLLTAVLLMACWLPARRAAVTEPIRALRCE